MILNQTRYSALNAKSNSEANSSIYSKDSSFNYNSDDQNLENNVSSFSEINDSRDELNKNMADNNILMKKFDHKMKNENNNISDRANLDFMCNEKNKENDDEPSFADCYSSMLLELDNDFDKITHNNDQLNDGDTSIQTPLNTQASDSSSISGIKKKY